MTGGGLPVHSCMTGDIETMSVRKLLVVVELGENTVSVCLNYQRVM